MKYSKFIKFKIILGNVILLSTLHLLYKIWNINVYNPYLFKIFLTQPVIYINLLILYISMSLHFCLGIQSIFIDYIKNKKIIYLLNFVIGIWISYVFFWIFI